jgi:hypothetical protein
VVDDEDVGCLVCGVCAVCFVIGVHNVGDGIMKKIKRTFEGVVYQWSQEFLPQTRVRGICLRDIKTLKRMLKYYKVCKVLEEK